MVILSGCIFYGDCLDRKRKLELENVMLYPAACRVADWSWSMSSARRVLGKVVGKGIWGTRKLCRCRGLALNERWRSWEIVHDYV